MRVLRRTGATVDVTNAAHMLETSESAVTKMVAEGRLRPVPTIDGPRFNPADVLALRSKLLAPAGRAQLSERAEYRSRMHSGREERSIVSNARMTPR